MDQRLLFRLACAVAITSLAACTTPDARRAPTAARAIPPAAARAIPPTAAATKPVWRARKVIADAVAIPGGRVHTVKPGETGIAIARAYGVEWRKLAAANHLSPPYVLEVGEKLLLPTEQEVAMLSVEARARAFDLDIDDIITGGDAAARPAASPRRGPVSASPAVGGKSPAATRGPALAGNTPRFVWPVTGRILSSFGAKPDGRFNDGVNLKASAGAPVRAAGDGVVAYAGDGIRGFGNLVLIKHAGGYVTAYGHNQALLVARGNRVSRGQIIARAGATGAVSEPQVHFELRHDRVPVDPAKVIGSL